MTPVIYIDDCATLMHFLADGWQLRSDLLYKGDQFGHAEIRKPDARGVIRCITVNSLLVRDMIRTGNLVQIEKIKLGNTTRHIYQSRTGVNRADQKQPHP